MPEENANITRRCCRCKTIKPLEEFPSNRSKALGRAYRCRNCDCQISREWSHTHSEQAKERLSKWRKTKNGNRLKCESAERDRLKFPEKMRARLAVRKALKNGDLAKSDTCFLCGKSGKIEGHHYLGYSPEHWLDVIWLCHYPCHKILDQMCL